MTTSLVMGLWKESTVVQRTNKTGYKTCCIPGDRSGRNTLSNSGRVRLRTVTAGTARHDLKEKKQRVQEKTVREQQTVLHGDTACSKLSSAKAASTENVRLFYGKT